MPATLSAAAKARNAEKRKKQSDRVNKRIKEAVAKAVAKCNERWRAKLIEERKKGAMRRDEACDKIRERDAARKEKKRIAFWERKVDNGSAVETTGSVGPRTFSY